MEVELLISGRQDEDFFDSLRGQPSSTLSLVTNEPLGDKDGRLVTDGVAFFCFHKTSNDSTRAAMRKRSDGFNCGRTTYDSEGEISQLAISSRLLMISYTDNVLFMEVPCSLISMLESDAERSGWEDVTSSE